MTDNWEELKEEASKVCYYPPEFTLVDEKLVQSLIADMHGGRCFRLDEVADALKTLLKERKLLLEDREAILRGGGGY
jgi:hypothetical protein